MFGGFDHDDVVTNGVYLIEVDIDNNISVSCNHSTLPKKLKESHAYEFQGTVHLENFRWNGKIIERDICRIKMHESKVQNIFFY